MRYSILPFVALFVLAFCAASYAAKPDTVQLETKIKKATVFFSGAQVTREGSISLSAGKHLIRLKNITPDLDPTSVNVKTMEGATILSVKTQDQVIQPGKTGTEKRIEKEIEDQKHELSKLMNTLEVYKTEEALLRENSDLGGVNSGTSVSAIKEAASYYRSRLTEIRTQLLETKRAFREGEEKLKEIFVKLNKHLVAKNKPYAEILLAVDCKTTKRFTIGFSYYVSSAGWEPNYDFRVASTENPLEIVYKADVHQSTREDWTDVKLTLSTGNPEQSGDLPELNSWYIDVPGSRSSSNRTQRQEGLNGKGRISGQVSDKETGEPLPFVNLEVYRGDERIKGANSDFDGKYIIYGIPAGFYDVKASFVGYTPKQIGSVKVRNDVITFQDIELSAGVELDMVEIVQYKKPLIRKDGGSSGGSININRMPERSGNNIARNTGGVSIRGARSDGDLVYIDGVRTKKKPSLIQENLVENELSEAVANLEYVIKTPYSIPSNGSKYNISIKEQQVAVDYIYQLIPKLDSDAFLTAQLPDWSPLKLLSGESNIYYQGTYIGSTYLDTDVSKDTLVISLGRDQNITVNRKTNKELLEKKFFGSNTKETLAWIIEVKNLRSATAHVQVFDQYPLARRESIEIEPLDNTATRTDPETGEIFWDLQLKPSEKKKLQYSYTIKYPNSVRLYVD